MITNCTRERIQHERQTTTNAGEGSVGVIERDYNVIMTYDEWKTRQRRRKMLFADVSHSKEAFFHLRRVYTLPVKVLESNVNGWL